MAEAIGQYQLGLEKAKDASNKERSLIRMQEQAGLNDSHNIDLTFLVCLLHFYTVVYTCQTIPFQYIYTVC